ncbi:MAG: hypothetical protein B7X34_02630, partial [Acidobacteriia bacterium 12-62-4]
GINQKTMALDRVRVLAEKGIRAPAATAIADKHKVHHQDLSGSLYLDPADQSELVRTRQVLLSEPGIEAAVPRAETAKRRRG